MLLASNYILNQVDGKEIFEIYPFVLNFCNLFEEKDPFEPYKIPDVNPFDLIKPDSDFSMVAGEFVEIYKE